MIKNNRLWVILLLMTVILVSGCSNSNKPIQKMEFVDTKKPQVCRVIVNTSEMGRFHYLNYTDGTLEHSEYDGSLLRVSVNDFVQLIGHERQFADSNYYELFMRDLSLHVTTPVFTRSEMFTEFGLGGEERHLILTLRQQYPEFTDKVIPLKGEKAYSKKKKYDSGDSVVFKDDSSVLWMNDNYISFLDSFSISHSTFNCVWAESWEGPAPVKNTSYCKAAPSHYVFSNYVFSRDQTGTLVFSRHEFERPEVYNGRDYVKLFASDDYLKTSNPDLERGAQVEPEKKSWGVLPVYLTREMINSLLNAFPGSEMSGLADNSGVIILGYPRMDDENSISLYKVPDKQIPSFIKTLYQRNTGGRNNCGQIDWENNVITLKDQSFEADWLKSANGVIWLTNNEEVPFDSLMTYDEIESEGQYMGEPVQEGEVL